MCLDNNDDIDTLKSQYLNATRLERGMVTAAEQKANVKATTIEIFLKRQKKGNVEYWLEFVVLDTSSPKHITDEVRTFTTSISKILRKDLPQDILHHFLLIISKTLVESTDYITTYGVQLFKMLIQFKDKCFELDKENNVVLSSSQGPKLKEYLPNDLNIDQPDHFLSPVPDRDFMNSDGFNKQLNSLFDTNHFQLIQSTYFKPRGPKESTLQKSPLHKALVDHIPPKNDQRQSLDVYIMKQALTKYTVNSINLWDNPKRLNNLLNCLLRVLLKIHLAPIREIKERGEVKAQQRFNYNEIKRRDKFIKKPKKDYANASKWLKRAERCDERINTYSEVLKEERIKRSIEDKSIVSDDKNNNNDNEEDDDSEELELEISSEHNPASTNDLLLLEDERPLKNTDVSRIRVSGTLIRNTLSNFCKVITQKIDSKVTPKQLSISAKKDINDRIALLKAESNTLRLQLKNAVQTRTNHIITSDIKVNDELYKKVEHHKLLTKRHNNELNFSEYGKDFTKKDEQNIVKKFEITKENYECFERTEDIELDEQVRYSEDLLFSGTDNGLVTMTETAKLDIKQVKFHLKLFNKYSILNDIKGKNVMIKPAHPEDNLFQANRTSTPSC
ncbi:hypothetical protein INT48_004860 [Thamnidium elegans]|uniref:Uncharacterized protein n=1 Tax=Thamnidium elegans TaxID=101142 RepID=A0A8H7SU67_9FUNG|nr:hypothetical protein INT48_004860 [Thamnidium elegans]